MVQTQAYCPKCRKTSWVEIDPSEFQGHIQNHSSVPLPPTKSNSGLVKRSLSHGDHILLLEIDRNGVVRKEGVVELISSIIEDIVAHTVERILLSDEYLLKSTYLLYISHALSFYDFFKSVISILMLNLTKESKLRVDVTSSQISFKYNALFMGLSNLSNAISVIKEKQISNIVVDIDSIPEVELFNLIQKLNLKKANVILVYNSRRNQNIPTDILNYFIERGITNLSLFDYSTGQGLNNIIEASFANLY